MQGLSAIVDGVGAYRTHIGSAHGRGLQPHLSPWRKPVLLSTPHTVW
ncbi:abortive infection family protein [Cellvibrio sp. QJXJ]|nr:abortive infection family protein [Cellvibrio sp. QJXJ]UUA74952.1 abortive infection family protein [Cellvibrio sp. QJXJ]